MRSRLLKTFLICTLIAIGTQAAWAADGGNRDRVLNVMTRNVDLGSDFLFIVDAIVNQPGNQTALLVAATMTFDEIVNSKMPARADALAAEIDAVRPDVVALQEVSTVKVGPLGQPPVNVVADQLELLMSSLHARGLHYAAVVQLNSDQSLPVIASTSPFELITVGVADHDVVLVRSDLPVSQLKVERVQMQHYAAAVVLPIDQDNQLAIPRGWIAVDVKLRGKVYRFVDTHLETLDPVVQGKQATELVNGPLATGLPVVLGGDLNSDANKPGSPFPAYGIVVDSGMTDVWNVVRTGQDGSTWPLFFEDPVTPSPGPVERIDLVLIKGAIRPVAIERTGLEMPYASDHAGVAASLMLLP